MSVRRRDLLAGAAWASTSLIPGCASWTPEQRRIDALREIAYGVTDGKTTDEEIRAKFGPPQHVNGNIWTYEGGRFSGGMFSVYFDKSGRVTRHEFSRYNDPCFIATAVYGSAECDQVILLRQFRDTVLLKRTAGRRAVALYYRLSPGVAGWLRRRPAASKLIRPLLDVLVRTLGRRS